jgi:dipeptidyl aminopeptidase/acylaminoacyl peptidase
VSTFGEDVISPAVPRNGNRLAYTRLLDDMNIWSFALDADGHVTSKAPLIGSTFRDSDPDYSPDGRRIAFTSGRNGSFGIWVSDSDGTNPRLLFDCGAYVTGSPRWSPDGRRIAFDSRANDPAKAGNPSIWTIDVEGGEARRLTTAATGDVAPSWSHDGRWIYFASTRSGSLEIWKMPAQGGAAVQVTRKGGFEAFESADGQNLLYVKGREIPGIWRVPTGGGEEVPVTARDQVGFWRCWRVARGGIYFATAAPPAGPRLEFLDLASGNVQEIARIPKPPDAAIPSLAVSPDGWIRFGLCSPGKPGAFAAGDRRMARAARVVITRRREAQRIAPPSKAHRSDPGRAGWRRGRVPRGAAGVAGHPPVPWPALPDHAQAPAHRTCRLPEPHGRRVCRLPQPEYLPPFLPAARPASLRFRWQAPGHRSCP